MPAEQNKLLIHRLFEEFVNKGNAEVADDVFAPNFVDHGSPPERQGLAGVKESFNKMRAAFPDLRCTLDDILAEGERVHVRLTIRGTHQGIYAGIPPTGASIAWTGMDDFRFANGKVVERWSERDRVTQIGQLRAAAKNK
jgi:predicted ester cyclase